ncbi:MAG: ATPase P, partial [Clostridia bacterium]|nr:ATPase P [Clostridia bacterium]
MLRDGEELSLPASELVIHDLAHLKPGDTVPADGILIRGILRCDESPLTGESRPVEKRASDPAGHRSQGGGSAALYRGSHVTEGEGILLVTSVGAGTMYGRIAGELGEEDASSPLKKRLSGLARTISHIGYVSAAVVAIVHIADAFWFDAGQNAAVALMRLGDLRFVLRELMQALTLAISVLVVAVPEGLPMMITVVLAANMKRMMKQNVLVRRLVGIETAGSVDMLFTDKTGTITTG